MKEDTVLTGLCFVTREEILVLESQMVFEGNSRMLTCSNYCSVSFCIVEIIASFANICHFIKLYGFSDECFCLIGET